MTLEAVNFTWKPGLVTQNRPLFPYNSFGSHPKSGLLTEKSGFSGLDTDFRGLQILRILGRLS